jgi:hypothetical protein
MSFKATKVKTWSDSKYRYTQTDFYSVVRDGSLDFKRIPVDGSEKLDDTYMDSIEPFDYSQMTAFASAYLSGYLAERYDVDAEAALPRANERITNTIKDEFKKTVTGYTTVTAEKAAIAVPKGTVHYALFPIWMLHTKYNGETYSFAMNGQTGKLIGRLPLDKGKYWANLFGITAIAGAIFTALLFVLRNFL